MFPSIFKSNQPVNNSPPKPTCASYTKAHNVIAQRQTRNCYSILFMFASISTLLLQLTQMIWPTWQTLIYALISWISLVILLFARLELATFQRKVESSLKSDIRAIFTRRESLIQLALYTTTSILLVFTSFILICQTTIPNRASSRQQRHRGGAQQLNVERFYVFIYACMLGLSFSLYRNFIQRWVIRLQVVQQHPLYLVKSFVRANLKTPLSWSFCLFCVSYLVYILFSGVLYKVATHFIGIFISVLDTPIVGFRWWDIVLFYRMFMIGCSIIWSWIFVDGLVDAYFNKVEDCISPYSNTFECLIDGLRLGKDNKLREHAFAELARLTAKDGAKRKDIYSGMDVSNKLHNSASTWSLIRTECLSTVDELTNRINQEYSVKKQQDKPKTDEPVKTKTKGAKSIQLVNGSNTVFMQRRQRTNGDYLDDRTTSLLSNMATKASDAIPSPDIHLGQLATNAWALFLKSKLGRSIASTRLDGQLGQWGHYLCDETRNRKIGAVLGNPLIQVSSIQALSNLVAFSLKEDDIGLVQYDIPSILNTFLGCATALDNYIYSPPPHYLALSTLADNVPFQAPYQLKIALDNSLLMIRLIFKNHLDDITVDEKYTARWNRY